MKILAISDVESKYLWDYFQPEKLEGVDLILSCGDLKASYLTLLATFTHAPLLYVHGNHDTDYQRRPPEGCTCIEDTVYEVNGVRIAGLGGSVRYKPGPFQYTQREMERRVARLSSKIRRMGGVDIIVAHAPVRGCNDGEDPAHMGFDCFNAMLGPVSYTHLDVYKRQVLCRVVIAFLVTVLTNINKIPLLGGVNRILGVCIGVVAGFINVLLILCLLWAVVVITNGNLPFVNDSSLSGSYFYSFFSAYNPFL